MATTIGASKPGSTPKPQKTSFFRDTKSENKAKKYEKKTQEEKRVDTAASED